jgi:hypothetical protein
VLNVFFTLSFVCSFTRTSHDDRSFTRPFTRTSPYIYLKDVVRVAEALRSVQQSLLQEGRVETPMSFGFGSVSVSPKGVCEFEVVNSGGEAVGKWHVSMITVPTLAVCVVWNGAVSGCISLSQKIIEAQRNSNVQGKKQRNIQGKVPPLILKYVRKEFFS